MRKLFESFLGVFGLPAGQPVAFYREVVLSVIGALGLLMIAGAILFQQTGPMVWVAAAMVLLCIAFASNKAGVAAGSLGCVALRFGIAFLLTHESRALLGFVICAGGVGAALAASRREV
jgi:hypothetical protein